MQDVLICIAMRDKYTLLLHEDGLSAEWKACRQAVEDRRRVAGAKLSMHLGEDARLCLLKAQSELRTFRETGRGGSSALAAREAAARAWAAMAPEAAEYSNAAHAEPKLPKAVVQDMLQLADLVWTLQHGIIPSFLL